MAVSWQTDVLCAGVASGTTLRLEAPISFWGGVCPETSRVTRADHPQYKVSICGKILVIPQLIGSSSSSAVMLELIHKGLAPCAVVLGTADAILPIGVVVADQMGWKSPPVCVLSDPPFATGDQLQLSRDGLITKSE